MLGGQAKKILKEIQGAENMRVKANNNGIDTSTLTRDVALNNLLYVMDDVCGKQGERTGFPDGTKVGDIVDSMMSSTERINQLDDNQRYKLMSLYNAVKNDKTLANLVIANQTEHMLDPESGLPYEDGAMSAATFQDSLTNPTKVTLVFKGTGDKMWADDANLLSGLVDESVGETKAIHYWNDVVEKNGWQYKDISVHGTAHSRGVDDIIASKIKSPYGSLIKDVYGLDGPGKSPESIESWKNQYEDGPEVFEQMRKNLYLVSADNDIVNALGPSLVPEENILYIKTGSSKNPLELHEVHQLVNEDGTLKSFGGRGEYGEIAALLSDEIMKLPTYERAKVVKGLMWTYQETIGSPSRDLNYTEYDYESQSRAVQLLFYALRDRPDLYAKASSLILRTIWWDIDEVGSIGDIFGVSFWAVASPFQGIRKSIDDNEWRYIKDFMRSMTNLEKEYAPLLGKEAVNPDWRYYERLKGIYDLIAAGRLYLKDGKLKVYDEDATIRREKPDVLFNSKSFVEFYKYLLNAKKQEKEHEAENKARAQALKDHLNCLFNYGYKTANKNPVINVDTYKLEDYAQRLNIVAKRFERLNRRIIKIGSEAGIGALEMMGQSCKQSIAVADIRACRDFLVKASSRFEDVESAIIRAGEKSR